MIRSCLKYMNVLNYLWGEGIRYFIYLLNRIVIRELKDVISYEVFRGRKFNIGYLRIFGCICYVKIEAKLLKKFDDRLRLLVYFGIESGLKAYRLFDFQVKRIVVSRDVVFDDIKGWNWK